MDKVKRAQLIATAKTRGYSTAAGTVLVTRSEFFDGNDDPASIGCNLIHHPGVAAFDAAFRQIESMDGVAGVYFAISDIDEADDSIWPFTDAALIVTRLEASAFKSVLQPLEPDEVYISEGQFANPPTMPDGYQLVQVWWD